MQVCLQSHRQKEMKWYLDSGCSRHMTRNKSWFKNLRPKDRGVIKFTDGIKSKIVSTCNVGKNDSDLITGVMLVEGLTHNLLSIGQFCDQGYKVVFEPFQCNIKDSTFDKIILTNRRCDNTYVLYLYDLLDQNVKCLAPFLDEKWMRQKKLGHAHIRLISKISKRAYQRFT